MSDVSPLKRNADRLLGYRLGVGILGGIAAVLSAAIDSPWPVVAAVLIALLSGPMVLIASLRIRAAWPQEQPEQSTQSTSGPRIVVACCLFVRANLVAAVAMDASAMAVGIADGVIVIAATFWGSSRRV